MIRSFPVHAELAQQSEGGVDDLPVAGSLLRLSDGLQPRQEDIAWDLVAIALDAEERQHAIHARHGGGHSSTWNDATLDANQRSDPARCQPGDSCVSSLKAD